MTRSDQKGKLYLIGAGPGDPELLTLKAVRCLQLCDVLLYDRLVNRDVLSMARPDAQLISVGKHPGEQERTQARILDLIRTHTFAGKAVGRLKGGDPFVFGRGAEEWTFALRHGISVEVVPGVSSALAVPCLAGIPLTFRKISQSFAIVTGHCHEGRAQEWQRYASIDTLVILMGAQNRAFIARSLIAAGRDADEPVAFIERGSLPGEKVLETTLGEVAGAHIDVRSPVVFVIGKVVKLRGQLRATSAVREPPSLVTE